MSLIKFKEENKRDGKKLHWHRAITDGAPPFRGEATPMYTEDEFQDKTARVADAKAETFDLDDAVQKMRYLGIIDRIVNNWFQCLYIRRRWTKGGTIRVHLEWVEYYLEDKSLTPFIKGPTERGNGFQSIAGDSA